LHSDDDGDGLFDGAVDVRIATAVLDAANGIWSFGDPLRGQVPLNEADPSRALLATSARNYFLALRMHATGYSEGELPSGMGLSIPSPFYVRLSSTSQVGVADNFFAIKTATSPIEREAARINVIGEDIAAWWAPKSDTGTQLPLSSYTYVDQGKEFVGMLKMRMWTDNYTGTIGKIRLIHNGIGADEDVKNIRLYVDTDPQGDPSLGNGRFESATDKEVTDPNAKIVFNARSADLPLRIRQALEDPWNEEQRTVSPSTITYFVAFDMSAGAPPNYTHGVQVSGPSDVIPLLGNGNVLTFAPIVSTNVAVRAPADLACVDKVDAEGAGGVRSVATSMTQADANIPVSKLTLKTNAGSAVWSGVQFDRWVHSASQGGAVRLVNKADDVTEVRVWADMNDNGLLDAATDQVVSPLSGVVHKFPQGRLRVEISSTAPSPIDIFVTNMSDFAAPDDNLTGLRQVPRRLVLGDDQIDENRKEVVECAGIDIATNAWRSCTRALDGTAQLSFSTGAVLSGPARIPILGTGGGQTLVAQAHDYFVTFDLDPLATVGPSTNLGIIIPNTFYFTIAAPKQMGITNIGLPPPAGTGKTRSLVSNVSEFADKVTVIATNTVDDARLGPFLQQKSTGAVLAFTLNTDVADALWRFVLVTASGTSAQAGAHISDVQLVSVWLDANDDGIFQASTDELLGTGTFGNAGNPLASRLNLFAPRKVRTLAKKQDSQRFFVAYLIAPNALANDPVTQAPRTLGAVLRNDAFPRGNPSVDEAGANAFSLPNFYNPGSALPFAGKVRDLIPSAQTLSVRMIPMFSSSKGNYEAPTLAASTGGVTAPGSADPYWIISSTAGLPSGGATTYLSIDQEIVSYGALGTVETPPGSGNYKPALIGIRRGLVDTSPAAHSSGTVLAPNIAQGS
ncbi:MAG: hypothetical protein AAB339_09615, partial [Elusimicrobiota bacterium]